MFILSLFLSHVLTHTGTRTWVQAGGFRPTTKLKDTVRKDLIQLQVWGSPSPPSDLLVLRKAHRTHGSCHPHSHGYLRGRDADGDQPKEETCRPRPGKAPQVLTLPHGVWTPHCLGTGM